MDIRLPVEQASHTRCVADRNGIPDNKHAGKAGLIDRVGKRMLEWILFPGFLLPVRIGQREGE